MAITAAAMFIGGTAFSMFQKEDAYSRKRNAARKAFKANENQRLREYSLERQKTEKANAYRLKIWNQEKKQYKQQLQWNTDAYNTATRDRKIQFEEVLAGAMFESQAMKQELLASEGRAAASGSTSRSARRREAIETTGEFGRQKAIQRRNLIGEEAALDRALEKITQDYNIANQQAHWKVAFAPEMEEIAPFIHGQFQSPERPNQFISGFNSVMDGLKAAAPFIPASSKAFGSQGFGRKLLSIAKGMGGGSIGKES